MVARPCFDWQVPLFVSKKKNSEEMNLAYSNRKMVPLYLTNEEKMVLDDYAESMQVSRQKILERIIKMSLDDMRLSVRSKTGNKRDGYLKVF